MSNRPRVKYQLVYLSIRRVKYQLVYLSMQQLLPLRAAAGVLGRKRFSAPPMYNTIHMYMYMHHCWVDHQLDGQILQVEQQPPLGSPPPRNLMYQSTMLVG